MSSQTLLSFFIPSEATFKPRPYAPKYLANSAMSAPPQAVSAAHVTASGSSSKKDQESRTVETESDDANITVIRAPFKDFPGAAKYPNGLTFALLSQNPDWCLDVRDFTGEDKISYPSHLEPPRGWCPAQKQRIALGGTGQATLRCTFCHRNYAGVNAKSMWRRHVYEKHKVAMSNRREGVVGRTSNKENAKEYSRIHARRHSVSDCEDVPPPLPKIKIVRKPVKVKLEPEPVSELYYLSDESSESVEEEDEDEDPIIGSMAEKDLSELTDARTRKLASRSPSPIPLVQPPEPSPYHPTNYELDFKHFSPLLRRHEPWRWDSPSHPLFTNIKQKSLFELMGSSSPLRPLPPAQDDEPLFDTSPTSTLPAMIGDSSMISLQDTPLLTPFRGKPFASMFGKTPLRRTSDDSPNASPIRRRKRAYEDGDPSRPAAIIRSHTSIDIFSSLSYRNEDHETLPDSSPCAPPSLKRRRTIASDGQSAAS